MSNQYEIERFQVGRCTVKIEIDPDPQNPRLDFDHVGTMACAHSRYDLGDKPYQQRGFGEEYLNELADAFVSKERDGFETRMMSIRRKWDFPRYSHSAGRLEVIEEKALQEFRAKSLRDNYVILPLGLYDHSGISMFVGSRGGYPFDSAGWDTSNVGFIYCSLEKAQHEYRESLKKATGDGWDAVMPWDSETGETKTLLAAIEGLLESEVEEYNQYLTGRVYGYVVEDKDGEHLDGCWGFFGDIDYVRQEARESAEHHSEEIENTERETALAEVYP